MKFTNLRYLLASAAVLAAAVSCVGGDFDVPHRGAETGVERVNLYIPEATTRTVIDNDEGGLEAGQTLSLKWAEGDAFALWAANIASGAMTFANAVFTHSGNINDPQGVLFTGNIPRLMAQDTYYYYGFYPVPAEENIDETAVRYDIPATQNGEYDPRCDIMRAEVSGRALSQSIENTLDLQFKHIMHVLKITIHSNPFGDKGIRKVYIEFPQPVAGRASVNIADGSFTLEEGRNVITAEFAEPKQAGDEFWVFVAPSASVSGEVRFLAATGTDSPDEYVSDMSVTTAFRRFESQHITPVNLGLRGCSEGITWFDYDIDPEQLGEDVEILHVALPEGRTFHDGTAEADIYPDEDGRFKMGFSSLSLLSWGSFPITAVFESASAVVPDGREPVISIVEGEYTPHFHNKRDIAAPYLFFEDFAEFDDMSSDDEYSGGFNTGSKNGKSFNYLSGEATGWTGARSGAQAGTAIRLAARREAIAAGATYPARLDSAPLANLKPEASVSVKLTFDYGANYEGARVSNNIKIGHVERADAFASNASNGTFDSANTFEIDEDDGAYDNLPHKDQSFVMSDCVPTSRITWIGTATNKNGFDNTTCWLYIDNVRVSIAK